MGCLNLLERTRSRWHVLWTNQVGLISGLTEQGADVLPRSKDGSCSRRNPWVPSLHLVREVTDLDRDLLMSSSHSINEMLVAELQLHTTRALTMDLNLNIPRFNAT